MERLAKRSAGLEEPTTASGAAFKIPPLLADLRPSSAFGEEGRPLASQGFAFINALLLAKVMLVFEDLDLRRWLERRPLIYPILFETSVLTILFLCFHVAEKTVEGLLRGKTLAASLPQIGGGGFIGLVSVATILFVALIPFFAFRNLKRALGSDRMNELVFGFSAKHET